MYENNKTYLTKQGYKASLEAHDGKPLTITRIVVGDGEWPPDTEPKDISALIAPRADAENLTVTRIENNKHQIRVEAVITGASTQEGFFIKETGVYANTDGVEILYAVVLTPDYPDYVWPENSGVSNRTFIDFYLQVTDAEALTFEESTSLYVTQATLAEAMQALKDEIKQQQEPKPIISDTPPENPEDGQRWKKPIGTLSFSGEVGGVGDGIALNLSGIHLGKAAPIDINMAWAKPIS